MVNQCIHLLDNTAKLLLLGTQLTRKSREAEHHVLKLLVLLFLLVEGTSVQDPKLVLELSLHVHLARTRLILLLAVDSDKIGELGSLLALTDL